MKIKLILPIVFMAILYSGCLGTTPKNIKLGSIYWFENKLEYPIKVTTYYKNLDGTFTLYVDKIEILKNESKQISDDRYLLKIEFYRNIDTKDKLIYTFISNETKDENVIFEDVSKRRKEGVSDKGYLDVYFLNSNCT